MLAVNLSVNFVEPSRFAEISLRGVGQMWIMNNVEKNSRHDLAPTVLSLSSFK